MNKIERPDKYEIMRQRRIWWKCLSPDCGYASWSYYHTGTCNTCGGPAEKIEESYHYDGP